ncbi:hypothetical protein CcaverHIS002_0507210 [Cutaneotrichosporon cavernicola]|uniref:Uncharacterized protein n=1 Tax=Cutaneotrichosporon cavernicola TaxID=279322 RepID=A0AA48L770_9TREE|nr:uncharacterized protein CcaverHIS019_0507760 [Cutaneotrichosporon cavernicola]BEI85320.1 hypothetical protein CcaverHIS002_0507210 [Cutaneotrichosporon cavernicola]BEI93148.1 hypothetical protein CcaverHIS019_0507760 [Cutaneotrichosporon cavernicola]BEJ00924.1 hypothetical protein CcaverHIS631_0507810 [Cutaneotrichosporon cavernicola]BEJ08690.1 hypothetical protein CcaverHIS641_0507840 [Cutaneotrichosporon cavernicola]
MSWLPLAALFLTHFDDLTGQEVVYYRSLSDDTTLPPALIEHTTLPSGLHTRGSDLVVFTHHGLPGAGVFRSRTREGVDAGRGRRMATLGAVLAPPTPSDSAFDLAAPLEHLYDSLEELGDPFRKNSPTYDAAIALLDATWEAHKAEGLTGSVAQSAATVAIRLARGVSTANPVTYLPALLSMLGPSIVTVYMASLSGQRILLYSPPPIQPLSAFGWCVWAMGLPPSSAANAGAHSSAFLGNIGLMELDAVKARAGGWVATTTDTVFKSHTDGYDMLIDLSNSLPLLGDEEDIRCPRDQALSAPVILTCQPRSGQKPTATSTTYAFADLALYRSLVLLDQSPRGVRAETVGFSATNRAGGIWLIVFEMLERVWNLCVGVCEFAMGRGHVVGPIALPEGEEDARRLLATDMSELSGDEDDEEAFDEQPIVAPTTIPDDTARRGRLILDQLHHNAYHLYARLIGVAAGGWELTDDNLRTLTGASRLNPWGGRGSVEAQFWLRLARKWNVEPEVGE